jgi:hypothetical protein
VREVLATTQNIVAQSFENVNRERVTSEFPVSSTPNFPRISSFLYDANLIASSHIRNNLFDIKFDNFETTFAIIDEL